jgi:hypothetical protein
VDIHVLKAEVLPGQAHTALGHALLASGDVSGAALHAEQAVVIQREAGHRLGEARVLFLFALALRRTGMASTADSHQPWTVDLLTKVVAGTTGRCTFPVQRRCERQD